MTDLNLNENQKAAEPSGASRFAVSCYEWVEGLIISLTIVLVLFVFLFRANIVVVGDSMKPNFQDGTGCSLRALTETFHAAMLLWWMLTAQA